MSAGRLHVSPRECRLVVDRLLLLQGVPLGAVPPIRDCILASQVAGLDALRELTDGLDAGSAARQGQLVVVETGESSTTVDCLDQHALLVAPALLDLVRIVGVVDELELHVRRVRSAEILDGLNASLRANGLTLRVARGDTADCRLTVRPDRMREEFVFRGTDVDEALWWRLFRRSNLVLSPDDPVSRRHAGATLVDDAGRVFGDTDDVIDLDLYQGRTSPGFDETRT